MTTTAATEVRQSPIGRIVVAHDIPRDAFLYWTTADEEGSLDATLRARLLDLPTQNAASMLASCHQVHETRAARIGEAGSAWCEENDCDALWTDQRGVALAIKVADCLPVTIIDQGATVVANIHAGWRGAAAGIVTKTVRELPAGRDYSAWLGPAIRSCCFEVGDEVVGAFEAHHGDVAEFVDRNVPGSNPHLDLAGIVTRELVRAGISPDQIRDTGLCTRCPDSIFHSYRRSGSKSGRNLAVAGLADG